jgi:hypothetical protein
MASRKERSLFNIERHHKVLILPRKIRRLFYLPREEKRLSYILVALKRKTV